MSRESMASSSSSLSPPSITIPMFSSSLPPPSIRIPMHSSSMLSARKGSICISPRLSSSITVRSSICKQSNCNLLDDPTMVSDSDKRSAPWLMLPPTPVGGDMVFNFYNLAKKKVIDFSANQKAEEWGETEVVGSSHGYLALFHKRTHHLFLYNPISRHRIALPSVHTLSLNDIGLGPLDMRVTKVVVSDDQSRAMMIFGRADRLAFCCPMHSTEWTPLGALFYKTYDSSCNEYLHQGRAYRDVVYSKRNKVFNCYTDCSMEEMEEWDLRLSRPGKQLNFPYDLWFKSQPSWFHDIPNSKKLCYVVSAEGKHSDQLYIVNRYIMDREAYIQEMSSKDGSRWDDKRGWDDRYPHMTIGFSVYKLTQVGRKTLQVDYMDESVDNLVMFIGRNHSFALPAQDYPELKPDSIYFTDDPRHTPLDWQTYGAHDTGIYCYSDKTFLPLGYPYDGVSSIKGIVSPPIWFTPTQD